MTRRMSRCTIGTGAGLIAALLSPGCEKPAGENTARADTAQRAAATRVVAVKPVRATVRRSTEQPGQVEAYEVTPIHAKISGYLRNLTVDIGSVLKKGQVMAEIWMPEIDAEFQQKQALIEQAKADLAQAQAAVEVAKANVLSAEAKLVEIQASIKRAKADVEFNQSEYARFQQLVREKAAPPSLEDEARNKSRAAEATRDEMQAKLLSAEAALAESRAFVEKTKSDALAAAARIEVARFEVLRLKALKGYSEIPAPYDGVVTRRNVDTGFLTVPGGTAEPLFIVARSDLVTITVHVPEMYAIDVEPGDKVLIRLQAVAGRRFEGTVTRTAWALDSATRTLRTEIDLPSNNGVLRPGLYAYATIIVQEHPDVLTLPLSAIVKDDDKTFCVCVENGKAVRRPIELGLNDGTRTEVKSGLNGGEIVVKANPDSLADSQALEVSELEGAATKSEKR